MLTPQNFREKTFDKAIFGGYDMAAVDDFLDEIVIEEYPELHISASIGGAFAAGRILRTIRRADLAMYQAKLKKDCVAIYREEKEHET